MQNHPPFIHPSTTPDIHLSIHPSSIHLSKHPSIHPSTHIVALTIVDFCHTFSASIRVKPGNPEAILLQPHIKFWFVLFFKGWNIVLSSFKTVVNACRKNHSSVGRWHIHTRAIDLVTVVSKSLGTPQKNHCIRLSLADLLKQQLLTDVLPDGNRNIQGNHFY